MIAAGCLARGTCASIWNKCHVGGVAGVMHAAPTVANGRVYTVAWDDHLDAFGY
jgi:hypothetical protein